MDDSDENNNSTFTGPIPIIFYSDTTGKPFQNCIKCKKNILENGELAVIAKKISQDTTFFEYAICFDCQTELSEQMSESSRYSMNNFFASRVNFKKRNDKLFGKENILVSEWTNTCVTCGLEKKYTNNHSLMAIIDSKQIIYQQYPMMICDICEEQAQELISKETRKIFDDFIDNHFDFPPKESLPLNKNGNRPSLLI